MNAPDDQYEEADAVADTVMRMPVSSPPLALDDALPTPPISSLQRSSKASTVMPEVETRIGQMQGGGLPIPGRGRCAAAR